jgi:hypothetical protein
VINVASLIAAHWAVVRTHDPMLWRVETQSALRAVSEILRLNRVRVSPESKVSFARRIFCGSVFGLIVFRLRKCILLAVPSTSCFDLIEIDIFAVKEQNLTNPSSIGLFANAVQSYSLARDEPG